MLKNFLPNEHVESVHEISPLVLKDKGIKGVITDLDNTLVPWDAPDATEEIVEWFQRMHKHGIKVIIASNNNEKRVKLFLNL